MLTNIIINFVSGLIAIALTGGIALHSTALDKAYAGAVSPESFTTVRDAGHGLSGDLHIHESTSPALTDRSHKRYTGAQHVRVRLSTLSK